MSRLFITTKEINLISDLTKEVIRDLAGQVIYYYPINELKTLSHEVYNEATKKVFDAPIQLPAMVGSPESEIKSSIFGPERLQQLEAYVQHKDMVDMGVNIVTGDFLRYGDTLYEITNVARLMNIYGHAEQLDGYKITATQARKGQFDASQLGPSDVAYADPDAVQKTFKQTRGTTEQDGFPTGDRRELQENGVLEKPLSGEASIVENDTTGSDFYGEQGSR